MHVLKLVVQLFLLCNSSGHVGPGQGVWVPQCIEPPTRVDLGPDHIHSFLLFLAGLQFVITSLLSLCRPLCFLGVFRFSLCGVFTGLNTFIEQLFQLFVVIKGRGE